MGGVFGTHAGIEMSDEAQRFFAGLIEQNDVVAVERCVQLVSRYDFTSDLEWLAKTKSSGVPVVVVAGKEDSSEYFSLHELLPC